MRVAIAGAHGKIAMRLSGLLVAQGHEVVGLVRNPAHVEDVQGVGASAVVCDLEHAAVSDVRAAVSGADVVVFAAGAGPGSGSARKLTMDRDGAIKLLEASAGSRYVIVSSTGAENPPSDDDVFSVYLRAKAEADAAVMARGRDWVVVRPGHLTDDPGAGRVRIAAGPVRGSVSRDDVAAVLAAVLAEPRANGHLLYVNGGSDPIDAALAAVLTGGSA